jgi:hypothetical protein
LSLCILGGVIAAIVAIICVIHHFNNRNLIR